MNKHYHLIGIGGIGMSGIAQLLLSGKNKVSGSDLKENRITAELRKSGALIYIGHAAANVMGADIVVYSSAIKGDNPEIIEARRLGIPLLMRAQALAGLMQDKTVITVAGSHGKTTTTSLVAYLLLESGLSPTVAIGGILKNIDTNACLGSGSFFVAEADESDGSFLYYNPKYSIVTNIDREHLDYYKDFKQEIAAFKQFLERVGSGGCAICCSDDAHLVGILKDYKKKYILFGLKEPADIYPKNIKLKGLSSEFDCFYKNKFIDHYCLALGGEHNISNALAVIVLGLELGLGLDYIKKALSGYKGASRRLEVKFEGGYAPLGISRCMLIDDYAHHPTEIRATLKAARCLNAKRLIAVFQPHRYSRTQLLLDEFSKSFSDADYLIVTDIYAASESAIKGVDAQALCERIKKQAPEKDVHFVPKEEIAEQVLRLLRPQDLVVTLGAGDIGKVSDALAEKLKNKK